MVSSPSSPDTTTGGDQSVELAKWGWRTVTVTQPDGSTAQNMLPLTPEEFIQPQEGYLSLAKSSKYL